MSTLSEASVVEKKVKHKSGSLDVPAPRVLIINSYHYQYKGTREMNAGITQYLAPLVKPENIHIEAMDERRFSDDAEHREKLLAFFNYKYSERYRPDLLIVTDDAALDMVLNQLSQFDWAKNIPLIFIGINAQELHDLSKHPNSTGIMEAHGIEENLRLIKQILPTTNKVVFIAGQTFLPRSLLNAARTITQQSEFADLHYEFHDNYSFPEMFTMLQQLPDNAAALVLAVHRDNTGEYFSYSKFIPEMSKISNAPLFGMWEAAMSGKGVMGGAMNSAYASGLKAGRIAVRILQGEAATSIPVIPKEDYRPILDYRQLQRFNIDETLIPKDTKVIFKPQSFYQKNYTVIWVSTGILLVSAFIIMTLLLNIKKRMHAERKASRIMTSMELTIASRTKKLAEQNERLTILSQEMQHQANSDALTGLANRRSFQRAFKEHLENANNEPDSFAIALIDLDDFKRINDKYGHIIGDKVLIKLGTMLRESTRPKDIVARWAGEEFIILLPSTNIDEAHKLCDHVRKMIAYTTFPVFSEVTISIGLDSNRVGDTCESLLSRIDQHLYISKGRGKNRVVSR